MYIEITSLAILGLGFSWYKFRDLLHPHFVLNIIMFFIFFLDFLVRGYDDKNLYLIDIDDVRFYQFVILLTISLIYLITYTLSKSYLKTKSFQVKYLTLFSLQQNGSSHLMPAFAWSILCLEVMKRLYFSHWSFISMLMYSFGPRFNRPWASSAGNVGDDKFLFALLGIVFPLAGLILSLDAISSKGFRRFLSALGYLSVLAFVIGVGSRTPVVLLIVFPMLYYLRVSRSQLKKCTAIGLVIAMLTISTSLIYNNRDHGFTSIRKETSSITYHQDDSYYRAIYAFDVASKTQDRWELAPFVGASLLNFIPRVIWPNKPTLTKDYWGEFKLHYVTITFIGELAALFGVWGAAICGVLVGLICFLFLANLYTRIFQAYNLLLYILGTLYVYMIFRSLLNITQFVYMLLFFFIVLQLDQRKIMPRIKI